MKNLLFVFLFPLIALAAQPAPLGAELTRSLHPDGQEVVTLECAKTCVVTRHAQGRLIGRGEIPRKTAQAEVDRFLKGSPTRNIAATVPLANGWKVWSGDRVSSGGITDEEIRNPASDIGRPAKAYTRLERALAAALKPIP